MVTFDVSWVGVILATVATVIIGGFWYSPALLGPFWARSHLFDLNVLKPSPISYGLAVLGAFVEALVLGVLIKYLPVTSILNGAYVGFLVWLGFVVTTQFSAVIWAKKPLGAFAVDITCYLITLVVSGAILAFFK
jgi:hypothetical protein